MSLPRSSDCKSQRRKRGRCARTNASNSLTEILTACAIFPHPAAMAGHFKGACRCPVCLTYLENPVNMKCGYICCLECVSSLRKESGGDGVLCPSCSEVSQKKDIRPNSQLGRLCQRSRTWSPSWELSCRWIQRCGSSKVKHLWDLSVPSVPRKQRLSKLPITHGHQQGSGTWNVYSCPGTDVLTCKQRLALSIGF